MKKSLSVLLPIRNGQARIIPLVAQALDLLPELTPRLDVLIVDNASTDETHEISRELATIYPQVHLVTMPQRVDEREILRTGLSQTSGEVLLYRPEKSTLDLEDAPKLWWEVPAFDAVLARTGSEAPLGRIPAVPGSRGVPDIGLCMLRRQALAGWRFQHAEIDWLDWLIREGHACREVIVRSRRVTLPQRDVREINRVEPSAATSHRPSQPRPNYLSRIKAFALGE